MDFPRPDIASFIDDEEQREVLSQLVCKTMPFGRFAGSYLIDLPEPYVVWLHSKGFPDGAIGEDLRLIYEIKLNGLEPLLRPLLDAHLGRRALPSEQPRELDPPR
ncbi:MAG: DUF3820 family protein [Pseudomonadota bacterium]